MGIFRKSIISKLKVTHVIPKYVDNVAVTEALFLLRCTPSQLFHIQQQPSILVALYWQHQHWLPTQTLDCHSMYLSLLLRLPTIVWYTLKGYHAKSLLVVATRESMITKCPVNLSQSVKQMFARTVDLYHHCLLCNYRLISNLDG